MERQHWLSPAGQYRLQQRAVKSQFGYVRAAGLYVPLFAARSTARFGAILLCGGFFAQPPHALLQLLSQRRWGVGVEGYQVPQRLGAVAAEAGQRGGVAIGVP